MEFYQLLHQNGALVNSLSLMNNSWCGMVLGAECTTESLGSFSRGSGEDWVPLELSPLILVPCQYTHCCVVSPFEKKSVECRNNDSKLIVMMSRWWV